MSRPYQLTPPSGGATGIDFRTALNEQQYAAVTSEPGASLVIAGAGSGKTRTLIYRVSWLLEQGYDPEEILLLTFTNKAAREMLERVNNLLPGQAAGLWGGTFHSIGHRILRRHAEIIGFQKSFTIMDRDDQEELLEAIVAREGLRTADKRFPKANVLAEIISLCSNTGEALRALLLRRYRYFINLEESIERIIVAYEERKKFTNAMDFDDLLTKTHELFLTHPEIATLYQKQFRALLVDEYQDTNSIQASLIDTLAATHGHLMVVGDDAQSIYSWRGAKVANILEFPNRYPNAQLFPIETNYRSVPQILELANSSILCNSRQFPKDLKAVRPPYVTQPALVPLATNNAQASFIAQRILELHEEGIPFQEMAVLYRAHYHSMEIQLELTRRGIPFNITSGLRFFEQAHIKDVAAAMKFALNPNDEVAFKRLIQLLPGIGKKTAESLWNQTTDTLKGTRNFSQLDRCKPPTKAEKEWKQLVHTLSELVTQNEEPVFKVAEADEGQGVDGAQKLSVQKLLDTSSTGATKPFAASVGFEDRFSSPTEDSSPLPQVAVDGIVPPATMITIIMFAFYDEIMKNKFTNYEARRDDLTTLLNYAKQFSDTSEFLAQLALLGESEEQRNSQSFEEEDRLTLSSIHQAKGLEWQVVFLAWLTEGMFPSPKSADDEEAIEEERRLFYVAVTRCKEELYLTYPELRLNANYGEAFQRPSRFLAELPTHLYERWEVR
ncbi:MAG: DNA helicase UvrD [Verrucomicrobia bacterium RIFCSPHIGHO2_12_FULL_41_10]|nr:MAG: DNA helicase UvrD [Verrucomicrobia bacterium RIFCSPHIGHO2_12_FULL_41_10]HLB33818.1 ATP-dependent helicase [Chthoniobacterales bacterium]